MLTSLGGLPLSAADSARAAASVYTASLLATAPLAAAFVGAVALRRASPEGRVLLWRAVVLILLFAFVGRLMPVRLAGWSVPSLVAAPLIALGRVRVSDVEADHAALAATCLQLLIVTYVVGAMSTLLPTIAASMRARRLLRRAVSIERQTEWANDLEEARVAAGVRRAVRLYESAEAGAPMTWGLLRPLVIVPSSANAWTRAHRRMVLSHEMAHVRAGDWIFGIATRVVCALFWFHPGVWWVARSLRRDAEQAADDRVLDAGVARSDYAELLIRASAPSWPSGVAPALSGDGSLRPRLEAILDVCHDVRPLRPMVRRSALAATAAFGLLAAPMSAVELSPTRDVLATLMRDPRWETRAYAVIGLAHRADSVAAARSAAELDPSPRVRAWARYALGLRPGTVSAGPQAR